MRLINADVLKELFPDDGEGSWTYNVTAKAYIDAQPTIEPEPKWIPCSERLPDEDGDYLVLYCTHSKYKPYAYDVISFANDLYQIDEYDFNDKKGQKGWFYCDHEYGYCEDNSVYAWMPLPEPCRAEGRTDEQTD